MSSDLSQKILDATNGGLHIILAYYPQAAECVNNGKKFRIRGNEKTASANIKLINNSVYVVTDFGGDQKPRNGILVCALEENCDFKQALKICITKFNVVIDDKPPVALKPKFEKRPATELEAEGTYDFKFKDELTENELEVVFAKGAIDYAFHVHKDNWKLHLNKVCAAYGFFALVSFTYVKDGQAIVTQSTDEYPIFVIKGDGFNKIYQPKSYDKAYRFRYSGKKEKDYVFGYKRFLKDATDLEKKWLDEKESDDPDQKPSGKAPQLPEVIICSGDRDSLNVAALGYNVVWQNSESAVLPWEVYLQLKKYAKHVYNLPDIDTTGLREGHEMALRFMEIKTINLPDELKLRTDWRGNPCKDVRDYLSYFSYHKFNTLVDAALEYKFWDEEHQRNKDGEYKKSIYVFNNVRAYNFIQKSGFYLYASKTERNGYHFIKVEKNIVSIIDSKDIKKFINQFLEKHYASDQTLRNTFYRSPQLKEDSLDNLKYIELDFEYYGKDFQYFFFLNKAWCVTPADIFEYKPGEVNKMVWENKVIQRNAQKTEAPFKLITINNADGSIDYDIEVLNTDCLFFRFLINTSRIHWRKELEEACAETYTSIEDQEKYRKDNQYNISGALLDEAEIHEQKQHLINKLFVLGFMLSRYKEEAKAWAPFIMDHKLSEEGESHGGSGKSIFARSVENFLDAIFIDGKSKSLTDDKFAFESVTELTELVLIDDLSRYLGIEPFFSIITGPMTVNPKHAQRFILPFRQSPRIAFTTNYGVRDVSPSAERRLLYCSFSDYYHNNQTGTYQGDYTPLDEFGKNLITDFTDTEFNHFINTMVSCLQLYMQIPRKFNPPSDNILKRNLKMVMGDAFMNWCDVYFSEESGRLNTMTIRAEAFHDFLKQSNIKNYSQHKFLHSLEAWCRYYRFDLNPIVFRNASGRITRKAFKKDFNGNLVKTLKPQADGSVKETYEKQAVEMIFIKTRDFKPDEIFADDEHQDDLASTDTNQNDLPLPF